MLVNRGIRTLSAGVLKGEGVIPNFFHMLTLKQSDMNYRVISYI